MGVCVGTLNLIVVPHSLSGKSWGPRLEAQALLLYSRGQGLLITTVGQEPKHWRVVSATIPIGGTSRSVTEYSEQFGTCCLCGCII
jgi:hypothetical protein